MKEQEKHEQEKDEEGDELVNFFEGAGEYVLAHWQEMSLETLETFRRGFTHAHKLVLAELRRRQMETATEKDALDRHVPEM